MSITITEENNPHPRVLTQTKVTTGGVGWLISSVRLPKTWDEVYEDPMSFLVMMRDAVFDVHWTHEMMIFKVVGSEEGREDYGHFRSYDPDEVLQVHHAVVEAIASEKLKPILCDDADCKVSSSLSLYHPKRVDKLRGNVNGAEG